MNDQLVWLAVLEEFMARTPALTRELALLTANLPISDLGDFELTAFLEPEVGSPQLEVRFNPTHPPVRLALHLSNSLLAFRRHCFANAYGQDLPALPFYWSASSQDQENFQQTLASAQTLAAPLALPAHETPTPPLPPPLTPEAKARQELERRLYHGVDQSALDAQIDEYLKKKNPEPAN